MKRDLESEISILNKMITSLVENFGRERNCNK